ncbi:hypothetical protein LPN04_23110, partial [Rugamonas sp. A1-17]|nr:hypothetical protein [Rugamonas sp. A1-17]
MEFLLFIFGVFTLSVAWRARTEARQARKIATELQREVDALREAQTTMQRFATTPQASPYASPPAAQPARPPAPAQADVPIPTTILAPPPPPLTPQV